MKRQKKFFLRSTIVARAIIQGISFLFLPSFFAATFNGIRAIYQGIIKGNLDFSILLPEILAFIAVVPITIVAGRFFCGWLCALGSLSDLMYLLSGKIFKRRFRLNEQLNFYMKFIKYIVLLGCVIFVWTMNLTFFNKISPWDIFGQLTNLKSVAATMPIGLTILVFILIVSMFIERFYCRYLCPLGAFFAITSKLRFFKIHKNREKCGNCRICTNNCPMGIPMYKYDVIKSGECINCMKCVELCPRSNTYYNLAKSELTPAIAGTVAAASIAGVFFTSNKLVNKSIYTINSPGPSEPKDIGPQGKIYKNGTYTGVSTGYKPNLEVSVTIVNDKITRILVNKNNESIGYKEAPFRIIPQRIIETQSTAVSVVSGATLTSNGIRSAVANALQKALLANFPIHTENNEVATTQTPEPTQPLPTPKETIDKTSSPTPTEAVLTPDNTNKPTQSSKPTNNKPTKPINSNKPKSPKPIESQAVTNKPIITPSPTKEPTPTPVPTPKKKYKDGEHIGFGAGYFGYDPGIRVKVTIKDDKIKNIIILEHGESEPLTAFEEVPQYIIAMQSTNVPVVSGATWSSNGIMDAVNDALKNALNN